MRELTDIQQQEEIRLRGAIEFYFTTYDPQQPLKKAEERIEHNAMLYKELTGESYRRIWE